MRRNNEGKRYDLRPRRTNIRHWQKWRLWYDLHKTWFAHVLSACTCTVMIYSRVCHLIYVHCIIYRTWKQNPNHLQRIWKRLLEWWHEAKLTCQESRWVLHGDVVQGWRGKLNRANRGPVQGWMGKLNGFCTSLNGDPAQGWARQLQTGSCLCVFGKMWEIHGLTFLELKQAVKRLRLQLSLIKKTKRKKAWKRTNWTSWKCS